MLDFERVQYDLLQCLILSIIFTTQLLRIIGQLKFSVAVVFNHQALLVDTAGRSIYKKILSL